MGWRSSEGVASCAICCVTRCCAESSARAETGTTSEIAAAKASATGATNAALRSFMVSSMIIPLSVPWVFLCVMRKNP